MTSLLKILARSISLHKHASRTQTGIIPFRSVRTAVLFLDSSSPDFLLTIKDATSFFNANGIEAHMYAVCSDDLLFSGNSITGVTLLHKRNINWFGRIKKNKRTPEIFTGEDIFISLCNPDSFAVSHAAAASTAKVKVGRMNPGREIYNIVITDAETPSPQGEVFSTAASIISRMR